MKRSVLQHYASLGDGSHWILTAHRSAAEQACLARRQHQRNEQGVEDLSQTADVVPNRKTPPVRRFALHISNPRTSAPDRRRPPGTPARRPDGPHRPGPQVDPRPADRRCRRRRRQRTLFRTAKRHEYGGLRSVLVTPERRVGSKQTYRTTSELSRGLWTGPLKQERQS